MTYTYTHIHNIHIYMIYTLYIWPQVDLIIIRVHPKISQVYFHTLLHVSCRYGYLSLLRCIWSCWVNTYWHTCQIVRWTNVARYKVREKWHYYKMHIPFFFRNKHVQISFSALYYIIMHRNDMQSNIYYKIAIPEIRASFIVVGTLGCFI